MGQEKSLEITYDDWRSFFLINPIILESITNDPHEMLRYWRTASVIDDRKTMKRRTLALLSVASRSR